MTHITTALGALALLYAALFIARYGHYAWLVRQRRLRPPQVLADEALPTVHVIVPCYNEGQHVYETARSLAALDYPAALLRVTIVEDCSGDDSADWVRRAEAELGVGALYQPVNRGKKEGVLAALAGVEAEIVAMVDSDVVVAPDGLRRLVGVFDDPAVGGACGLARVLHPMTSWLTRFQALEYFVSYEVEKSLESRLGSVVCISGCFCAYRAAALRAVAEDWRSDSFMGVTNLPGEDRALTRLVLRAGYATAYRGDAVAHTRVPITPRSFLLQRVRWTRSFVLVGVQALPHLWRRPWGGALLFYVSYLLALCAPLILWPALTLGVASGSVGPLWWGVGLAGLLALDQTICQTERALPSGALAWTAAAPGALYWPLVSLVLLPYAAITFRDSRWMTRQPGAQQS